jgi:hypothetical protein
LKILTVASVLALWAFTHGAHAQDRAKSVDQGAASTSRIGADIAQDSAVQANAAREKSEALERARDQRLRRATRSICSGC